MEKDEFRAVIKHLYLKQWTAAQSKAELSEVHEDSVTSLNTIYYWINELKRGRTSTQHEARSGCPVAVTTPEMVSKIRVIVMEERRVKVREIAEIVCISTEKVHKVLREESHMKKVCARWVLRLLTIE